MAGSADQFQRELDQLRGDVTELDRRLNNGIRNDISTIQVDIAKLVASVTSQMERDKRFVTQEQFKPVARMTWLFTTMALGGMLTIFGWALKIGHVLN